MADDHEKEAVRQLLATEHHPVDQQSFMHELQQVKEAEKLDDATLRQAVNDLIQEQGGMGHVLEPQQVTLCGRCAGGYGCGTQSQGGRCSGSYGCCLVAGQLVPSPNEVCCVPAVGPVGLLVLGAGMAAIAALRQRAAGHDEAGGGGTTEP